VIDHITSTSQEKTGAVSLAYHYCDFADSSTLDPRKTVGSLLRQLAQQMDNISPVTQNLYHKFSGQSPPLHMLFEVLACKAKQTFETTYLIIDGLDESPNRRLLLEYDGFVKHQSRRSYSKFYSQADQNTIYGKLCRQPLPFEFSSDTLRFVWRHIFEQSLPKYQIFMLCLYRFKITSSPIL
jgi:hypothetical protein